MKFLCIAQSCNEHAARDSGFTIIENLIAVTLLSLVIASNSRFIISSMFANQSARAYDALAAEVQKKVDTYRSNTYSQLLDKFGSNHSAITDGQTATENGSTTNGRSSYVTSFTANKSSNTGLPESVGIKVVATQRRGKFANASFSFETVIAQMR